MKYPGRDILSAVYGEKAGEALARYRHLGEQFEKHFGPGDPSWFSAPGRTEIVGNHTDHNGGKILAASISMDTICAARKRDDGIIRIVSEGYREPVVVDLQALRQVPKYQGSVSLVAGMAEGAEKMGYRTGGFEAYVTTEVISSAGLSSSASYEMLLCTVLNHFYNGDRIPAEDYARIGQYAENHWWGKASGLMDQMACAIGGTILLDFSDGVHVEKADFTFADIDCDLLIINTGKGHADLSAEYSAIPEEMKAVAHLLGAEQLAETNGSSLVRALPEIRETLRDDRALLRAMHFYAENQRVERAAAAIREGRKKTILSIIKESGNSSWKWLQNCYVDSRPGEQPIPLLLALAEAYFANFGRGVCRVHGGGFAGVIMCVVPKDMTEAFTAFMEPFAGAENICRMSIRQTGAVCLESGETDEE